MNNLTVKTISFYSWATLVAGELDFSSTTSRDGTKPRKLVEREIEIYRETLKITKTFWRI